MKTICVDLCKIKLQIIDEQFLAIKEVIKTQHQK